MVGPFLAFFKTWGWVGLLMLVFISLYRLPEFVMGPMATPFYHDLGLSKDMVGAVRARWAWPPPSSASRPAGCWSPASGYMPALIIGGILQALAIASFAILASTAGTRGCSAP